MEELKTLEAGYFKVIIKANAKKTEFLGWDSKNLAYKIAVSTPPKNNKANLELIRFLTKEVKKKVKIVSGATEKIKLIKIL